MSEDKNKIVRNIDRENFQTYKNLLGKLYTKKNTKGSLSIVNDIKEYIEDSTRGDYELGKGYKIDSKGYGDNYILIITAPNGEKKEIPLNEVGGFVSKGGDYAGKAKWERGSIDSSGNLLPVGQRSPDIVLKQIGEFIINTGGPSDIVYESPTGYNLNLDEKGKVIEVSYSLVPETKDEETFLQPLSPNVGRYFQVRGPNNEEDGKYATIYYKGKDGTIAFNSMLEMQYHMLENNPEMLKNKDKIKEIIGQGDKLTDKEKLEKINKLFVTNVEDINSVSGTRIKDGKKVAETRFIEQYDFNQLSDVELNNLNLVYESKKNPETQEGASSLSKGYLEVGEYVSDDYDPNGDEAGYTGKAKKVVVPGQTFNPSDPSTYKWQYEVKGQRQNDGTLVPGTENEISFVDAGEVDEDAYKKFKKPPAPTKEQVDTEKDKKIGKELGSVVTALKAGAGIIGLGKAMKDIPIGENQELSDSFKAYMQKSKELSESGLTAAEKASIRTDLSNAYSLGAKNVLRASGGNRGTFLANMGMLNTNRVNSLIKMGEIDAKMQRQNMEAYGKMLTFQEKFKAEQGAIGREMAYKESLRKSNLYGGLGSSLIGSAISDLTYSEQMKNMEPYMSEWAKNMGLITTSTDTEGDAADDASLFVNTG